MVHDSDPEPDPTPDAAPADGAGAGNGAAAAPTIDEETPDVDADEDFGPPFVAKTFGGSFVWAKSPGFVATVLRIKEGGNVAVSTHGRRDMFVMLTGGRAVMEVGVESDIDHVELLPAAPVTISPDRTYRLLAITEVEIFTVYSPL